MRTEEAVRRVCRIAVFREGNPIDAEQEVFVGGKVRTVSFDARENAVRVWMEPLEEEPK